MLVALLGGYRTANPCPRRLVRARAVFGIRSFAFTIVKPELVEIGQLEPVRREIGQRLALRLVRWAVQLGEPRLAVVGGHLNRSRRRGRVCCRLGIGLTRVLLLLVSVARLDMFRNLRRRLDVAQGAVPVGTTKAGTAKTASPDTGPMNTLIRSRSAGTSLTSSRRWSTRLAHANLAHISILDTELGHGAQLPANPPSQDLATLLLAETAAGEVASVDERDNVHDDLVLVEHGVDDDGHDGREVGLARNFDEDDNETTGLEYSAGR
jgi:hypothetical protein